jgi:hypothetical protein
VTRLDVHAVSSAVTPKVSGMKVSVCTGTKRVV